MHSALGAVVSFLLLTLMVGACSAPTGGTRAGGDAPPVTLTMGTDDVPGKPASLQIEEFARRVGALSEGRIIIRPTYHAAGDGPDWDQRVARMVVRGELDMGSIPSRAWDTEEVTTLRALNAPFLITSDELAAAVARHEMVSDLMAGLREIGIHGLALVPEGLRHPFSFGDPLEGPADYRGAAIRSPTSAVVARMFAALGAVANDDRMSATSHAAAESAYVLQPPGKVTANVTYFPKFNSLVINAARYEELTDQQRYILQHAAEETRDWAIETQPPEAELAVNHCELGYGVHLAPADEVAALEAATASVTAWLEEDAATRDLIAAIRELRSTVSEPAPPPPCEATINRPTPADVPASPIDGSYRIELSEDLLRVSGVTNEQDIRDWTGVYTFTFANGNVSFVQTGPYPESNATDTADHFTVEGNTLSIIWPDGLTEVYSFEIDDNGDLHLEIVSAPPAWLAQNRAFVANPWVRVDD